MRLEQKISSVITFVLLAALCAAAPVLAQEGAQVGVFADLEIPLEAAALSTFGDVAEALVDDADDLAHPVLDALAGDAAARERLAGPLRPETTVDPDHRDPAADRLLLDADTEQERVVELFARAGLVPRLRHLAS